MMEKITVRQFELSDLESTYEIEIASFKFPWAKSDFKYYYTEHTEGFLVAIVNSAIAGFVIAIIPFEKKGHILNLAVHTDYRDLGVGRELVNSAISRLKRRGVSMVWLEVRISNAGARAFYRKLGFIEKGILIGYYLKEDAVVMVKEI